MHTSPKHKFRANVQTVYKREYRTKTDRGRRVIAAHRIDPGEGQNRIAKSLIIIEIEKVEDTVSPIEQQHATAINDSLKVARQPRKFFFAC